MSRTALTLLLIVLLSLLVPVGTCENTAAKTIFNAASGAISNGIEAFFISAADSMFEMSFSGFDNSAGLGTVGLVYNAASYTPNPMDAEITQDFIEFSKTIFKSMYPILLLCAFIALLLTHYQTGVLRRLEEITGVNVGTKSNILATKALHGIIVAVFMYMFIFLIFKLNDVLTKAVMIQIIDVISPTPDNFILYFMMGVSWLCMGFFFSIRILILYLFCGFAFIIGLCLLIDYTKDTAAGLCAYFVQIVYFQFFTVLYYSACILIIKEVTSPTYPAGEQTMYVVMIIGGVYIAVKMMFGTKVIRIVGRTAGKMI